MTPMPGPPPREVLRERLHQRRDAAPAEAPAPFPFPRSVAGRLDGSHGNGLGARNKLSGDGRWESLRNELIALSNEMNAADDGHFRAPSEYLVTLAGKLN